MASENTGLRVDPFLMEQAEHNKEKHHEERNHEGCFSKLKESIKHRMCRHCQEHSRHHLFFVEDGRSFQVQHLVHLFDNRVFVSLSFFLVDFFRELRDTVEVSQDCREAHMCHHGDR